MINVYDFDKTIYDGDSSIEFYLYCLKKRKRIICLLPIQVVAMILYLIKLKKKEFFKEAFFSFVKYVPDIDQYVKDFWKEKLKNIKPWYWNQKKETDVIISASPEFLLKPLEKELQIAKVIATKVNKKTGKFESDNCYGEEKVKRFTKEVGNKKIKCFYSDSFSDLPMMVLSQQAYLIKKESVQKIDMKKLKTKEEE